MSTVYKDEIFGRLLDYINNYERDPVTYPGFLKWESPATLLSVFNNDPIIAALAVMTYTGKYTPDEAKAKFLELEGSDLDPVKTDLNIRLNSLWKAIKPGFQNFFTRAKHYKEAIKPSYRRSFLNEALNIQNADDKLINLAEDVLDVSFQESYPFGKSPADVPDYVTNIYLEGADEIGLGGINDYIETQGPLSHEKVYDVLKHTIDYGTKVVEDQKKYWLDLKPIEFFKLCIEDPSLLTRLSGSKDAAFKQSLQSKFTEGQLEFLKSQYTSSVKTQTVQDLSYIDRMECGVNDDPLDYAECGLDEDPINLQNIYNQQQRSTLMDDVIREGLKNTVENNEVEIEQMNTEHNSDPIETNSDLWKILGITGGVALLGGGAYAAYRWWQYKKQQEELEKQRLEEEKLVRLQQKQQDTKNKSRQRKTVINNIVYTKPQQDLDYNV